MSVSAAIQPEISIEYCELAKWSGKEGREGAGPNHDMFQIPWPLRVRVGGYVCVS